MKQVFHPWNLWEDYDYNFYSNCTGSEKISKIESCVRMFNSESETERCMNHVVMNWTHSMEHYLTNPSVNKIAYIGQSACAYFDNVPSTVTMECWSGLPKEIQNRANQQAEVALNMWIKNNKHLEDA